MLLHLVRHGSVGWVTSPGDHGLDATGRAQAGQTRDLFVSQHVADHPIEAVYGSPLRRAQQTAATIAAGLDLPVVTEVLSWEEVPLVAQFADMLQIGARNMQNFSLLRAAARSGVPVLLKRGAGATIEEWLMAAEYVLAEGNPNVVLCERGIRTFERATRHTLDLNAVVLVRERSHLPVVVDPSHAAGVASLVTPLAEASLAAGAAGLIVEVHPNPKQAMSDGPQSLDIPMFIELARRVHPDLERRKVRELTA